MTNIIDFIKMVSGQIKQGFKAFTIYKNSKGQQILSIGSYSIVLPSEMEIKIAVGVISLLLIVLASVDQSISMEAIKYLDINNVEAIIEAVKWSF